MTATSEPQAATGGGIVCVGNFIVDRVHRLSYWPEQGNLAHILDQDQGVGGGAANVAIDLASFGFAAPIAAAGTIGCDADGTFVRACLEARSIETGGLIGLADRATAHTLVMTVPGQSRTFFYHGGANDALHDAHVDPHAYAQRGFRLFYLGYLMLLPGLDRIDDAGLTGAARLLQRASEAGLTTCVDFVSSEDPAFAASVAAALPHCDHLIINEMEASRATGIAVREAGGALIAAGLQAAAEALVAAGVRRSVILHAPECSLWLARGEDALVTPSIRVPPEAIVSPVGAGDAFCAAILHGLHAGWTAGKTALLAHLAAAHCLSGATATDGIPSMAVLLTEAAQEAARRTAAT